MESVLIPGGLAGDEPAPLGALLAGYRERLVRMVDLRLDPRLRGRIDASDVVQDAYVEVAERLPRYVEERKLPFFVWVRFLTAQRLAGVHRQHLGAAARDIGREEAPAYPEARSSVFASALLDSGVTTPSMGAARVEEQERVQCALEQLKAIDREVLALRHFELLDNTEVAHVLGLTESAASRRYLRALEHVRELLEHPARRDGSDTR